jgi:two-component system response regulator YesN
MQPLMYRDEIDELVTLLEGFRLAQRRDDSELPREIRQILACIHEHLFSSGLNVQQLKRRCRIRDNNISSRFRRALGLTMKDYIESLRMEAAALLLRERRVGIFDVAQSIGYDNPQTFYRAFAKRFQCTPAAYRRSQERRSRSGGHWDGH